MNDLQRQYEGFIKTPPLWYGDAVYDLNQFHLPSGEFYKLDETLETQKRLGHLAEAFLRFQLKRQKDIEILDNNVQIMTEHQITVGEIDFLLKYKTQYCHLENVYKFYLYDPKIKGSELDKLVGPNKRDWLVQKLEKLKQHQLPLIYRKECRYLLEKHGIKPHQIEQYVCFKAQLFLPFGMRENSFKAINGHCATGHYLSIHELDKFRTAKFFLPKKRHWFSEPHPNVEWASWDEINPKITGLLATAYSPLCWVKKPNGELLKCFVVWW